MQKESKKGIKAEALKKLNFDEIKKLIDESPNNGKDIIVIGDDNLTPEIVEYIHKKHAKVGIERLDENEITALNFTYPKNAKAIIDYQGIQHALNKHGINSPSVKFSKQPPITYKDIANYRDIVKNADETIKRDNRIISYKLLEQACLTDYRNNNNDALPEWNVQEQGKDWPNDIKDEHANITQKAQNREKAVHRKAIDKPSGTLKD
ncbi:PBECR3 domain-containing polyvalent protein [Helicobacter pylori]|uniref:PBECR3 domain-containing polyvalent protein n=1 Tax=Helicobacter pylori TaxID=210 RepID=UPI00359CAD4D